MFVTHGPVPPDSRLFVGRSAELKRIETWLTEVNCVGAVLGARQTGKTSLLLKLRHVLRDKYAFVFVDLQLIEGAEVHECFNYIAEQMVEQLAGIIDGPDLPLPKDNKAFSTFLRDFSRRVRAVRVIVILDEVGSLTPDTAIKLAGTIRAVFTERIVRPELARYMFLLAGAMDMLELTTGKNSPLGNVTERIYLGDLSLAETEQLVGEAFQSSQLRPVPRISDQLHTWTSGHPYWTQLLAAILENERQPATEETIEGIVEQLLRTEAINLPHVIGSLRSDTALWRLVESLLDGIPLYFSRANAAIARLELIGILKDHEGRCMIRNRIYQEAMHKHQIKPARRLAADLRRLSQQAQTANDLQSFLHGVGAFLQEALQSRALVVFTAGLHDSSFRPATAVGIPAEMFDGLQFASDSTLLEILRSGRDAHADDLPRAEQAQLHKVRLVWLLPIRLKDVLLGFLALGSRLSGEEYDTQDREFLLAAAEQVAAGIERLSLQVWQQDAERAQDIQRDLLPKEIPQVPGIHISCTWLPARFVGGDYYDVLKLGAGKTALCIGDVVGKGMPAALLMSNLQATVKAFASDSIAPKDICEQINRLTSQNISPGKFITFFYGLIDEESRHLTYTNAGHNPPIVVRRDGTILRLDVGGMVLGVFPDSQYTEGHVDLASGDQMVLFTDGVTEATSPDGQEFGEERLAELVSSGRELNAAQLQETIVQTITKFSRGNFHDDIALVTAVVY
jgi:serine phosphatase RsbU (regulator of sigma subunit)